MTQGVFNLPFVEQSEFLRQKLSLPTERWDDIRYNAHDRAWVVAGAQGADLLADLHDAVQRGIDSGEGLADFRKRFPDIVKRRGWSGWTGQGTPGGEGWRMRVIFETNLQTNYAAGRLRQLNEGGFSHWVYKHSHLSAEPRAQHLAWDGLTLPKDDPFWRTHYPPNGWRCRCRVVGVRGPEAAKRVGGEPGKRKPMGWDAPDPRTGEPEGIGKGWGYQPGADADSELRDLVARKLISYPPAIARAMEGYLNRPSRSVAMTATPGRRSVMAAEREIANSPVEVTAVFDQAGNPVMRKSGDAMSVGFTREEQALLRNAVVTHNHPVVSSFSVDDIRLMLRHGVQEMRAIDAKYVYRMARPGGRLSQDQVGALIEQANEAESEVWGRWLDLLLAGEIAEERFAAEVYHEVWLRFAAEGPLDYTRVPRNE